MRIVAGRHRGRPLAVPPGGALRPTSDRARESVFNILVHGGQRLGRDAVAGACVLDAFAGTGAMGLEALSRGAAHATLMDSDLTALDCCRANVKALGEQANATVLGNDCLSPPRAAAACDLIFLDPPYRSGLAAQALEALDRAGWIAADAICVIEMAAREAFAPPEKASVVDERRYGAARVVFLRWAGGDG